MVGQDRLDPQFQRVPDELGRPVPLGLVDQAAHARGAVLVQVVVQERHGGERALVDVRVRQDLRRGLHDAADVLAQLDAQAPPHQAGVVADTGGGVRRAGPQQQGRRLDRVARQDERAGTHLPGLPAHPVQAAQRGDLPGAVLFQAYGADAGAQHEVGVGGQRRQEDRDDIALGAGGARVADAQRHPVAPGAPLVRVTVDGQRRGERPVAQRLAGRVQHPRGGGRLVGGAAAVPRAVRALGRRAAADAQTPLQHLVVGRQLGEGVRPAHLGAAGVDEAAGVEVEGLVAERGTAVEDRAAAEVGGGPRPALVGPVALVVAGDGLPAQGLGLVEVHVPGEPEALLDHQDVEPLTDQPVRGDGPARPAADDADVPHAVRGLVAETVAVRGPQEFRVPGAGIRQRRGSP